MVFFTKCSVLPSMALGRRRPTPSTCVTKSEAHRTIISIIQRTTQKPSMTMSQAKCDYGPKRDQNKKKTYLNDKILEARAHGMSRQTLAGYCKKKLKNNKKESGENLIEDRTEGRCKSSARPCYSANNAIRTAQNQTLNATLEGHYPTG